MPLKVKTWATITPAIIGLVGVLVGAIITTGANYLLAVRQETADAASLGMRWSELDLDKKIWTVPAKRMKAGREHRVPLAPRAVTILRQLEKVSTGEFVFAGRARNKPLSNMAMEMVLRRMNIDNATVHGFRSSFRDWAGNVTNFPREVTETALAHVIGDKAEQAYRRGDALEKRRKLMEAWAGYCEPRRSANVVPMRGVKAS
jgi:hypothetical protein